MVFAWGTNYKLSLYKSEHGTPPAKVCTRGSDVAKTAFLAHAAKERAIVQPAVAIAVLCALLSPSEDRPIDWVRRHAAEDLAPLSSAPTLYLRPPPDELRLLT
jgi:hypothetical protein